MSAALDPENPAHWPLSTLRPVNANGIGAFGPYWFHGIFNGPVFDGVRTEGAVVVLEDAQGHVVKHPLWCTSLRFLDRQQAESGEPPLLTAPPPVR